MDRKESLALAESLGPPNERLRPSMDFMAEMYYGFHTEIGALLGRSALERPYDEQQLTIAEQFFREVMRRDSLLTVDLMEINRTIMNVYMERALLHPDALRGSYEVITDCQKNPDTRLLWETHGWLRGFTQELLATPTRQRTMEVGLMRADLGKSDEVRDDMRARHGRDYADHDQLMVDLSEDAKAVWRWNPSFYQLPPGEQQLLRNCDRSGYHMPQDLRGESPPSKLVNFYELTQEEQDFALLLGLLDISGAQGDRVQNGSKTLIEPVVNNFKALRQAHMAEVPPDWSKEQTALFRSNLYRKFRGQQVGLTFHQPSGYELIRLSCNLDYASSVEADFMQEVMATDMQTEDRDNLLELMSFRGFEPGGYAWIMYLPALITRYKEKLEDKRVDSRLALDAGLTLAARTYAAAKQQIDLSPGVVIVAGDLVRAFEKDPRIPQTHRIRIDSVSPTEAKASFDIAA